MIIIILWLFLCMEAVGNLLNIMTNDWKVEENYKRREMLRDERFVRFMAKLSVAAIFSTVFLYTIVALKSVNFSPSTRMSNVSNIRPLFLSSKFFFEIQTSPIYEIIWVCQIISVHVMAIAYGCYEALFIILVFHVCAQLRILKLDLRDSVTLSKEQTFTETIKPIVQRHFHLKR